MESVKETTDKAVENVKEASKQIKEVTGDSDVVVRASSSGKGYKVRPCSLDEMPELSGLLEGLQKKFAKGAEEGKTEYQLMMDKETGLLDTMAKIIYMGIKSDHPDMTIDKIKSEFSLGDFPKVYQEVLDLNDFLSGMRTVLQMV
jgi:hypothetical protein